MARPRPTSLSSFTAINGGVGAGTAYSTATTFHPGVTALDIDDGAMIVTAKLGGTVGNAIAVSETLANGVWDSGDPENDVLGDGVSYDDLRVQLRNGTVFTVELDHDPSQLAFSSTLNGGGNDIEIQLADGNGFEVNLEGAGLVGDVVRMIEDAFAAAALATGGLEAEAFEVRVDAAAGTVTLVDFTQPIAGTLLVSDIPGSQAAADLNLDGAAAVAQKFNDVEALTVTTSLVDLGSVLNPIRAAAATHGLTSADFDLRLNVDGDGIDIVDNTSPATVAATNATEDSTTSDTLTIGQTTTALNWTLPSPFPMTDGHPDLTGYTLTLAWTDAGNTPRVENLEVVSQSIFGGKTTFAFSPGFDPDDMLLRPGDGDAITLSLPFTVTSLNFSNAQGDLGLYGPGSAEFLREDAAPDQTGVGIVFALGDDLTVTLRDGSSFSVDLDPTPADLDELLQDIVDQAPGPIAAKFDLGTDFSTGEAIFQDFSTGIGDFTITDVGLSTVAASLGLVTGEQQAKTVLFDGEDTEADIDGTLVDIGTSFDAGTFVGKIILFDDDTSSEIVSSSGEFITTASAVSPTDKKIEIIDQRPYIIPVVGSGASFIKGNALHGDPPGQHAGLAAGSGVATPHLSVLLGFDTQGDRPGPLAATDTWGPFGVAINGGRVDGTIGVDLTFDDSGNAAGSQLATLPELLEATDSIDVLIETEAFSSTLDASLPIEPETFTSTDLVDLTGGTPDTVNLSVSGVDVTGLDGGPIPFSFLPSGTANTAKLQTLLEAFDLSEIDAFVAGLSSLAGYFEALAGQANLSGENLLAYVIPGIGRSIADLVDLGETFSALVDALETAEPRTLQEIEDILEAAFNSTIGLSHDTTNDAIKIEIDGHDLGIILGAINFFLDLTQLAGVSLTGLTAASIISDAFSADPMGISLGGTINVDLGIPAPHSGTASIDSTQFDRLTDDGTNFATLNVIGLELEILTGNNAGQTRTIQSVVGTDTLVLDAAFDALILQNEEYLIRLPAFLFEKDGTDGTFLALDAKVDDTDLDFDTLMRSTVVGIEDGSYSLDEDGAAQTRPSSAPPWRAISASRRRPRRPRPRSTARFRSSCRSTSPTRCRTPIPRSKFSPTRTSASGPPAHSRRPVPMSTAFWATSTCARIWTASAWHSSSCST